MIPAAVAEHKNKNRENGFALQGCFFDQGPKCKMENAKLL